jgi:hypothetical protein
VSAVRGGEQVIYCVVPRELGEEAFARLVEHYKESPNVKVIVDRRQSDRRKGGGTGGGGARTVRDRRQRGGRGVADIQ